MMKQCLYAAQQLERMAAWHRMQADHAEAVWIWEARLLAAEALEQRAAEFRRRPIPTAPGDSAGVTDAATLQVDGGQSAGH